MRTSILPIAVVAGLLLVTEAFTLPKSSDLRQSGQVRLPTPSWVLRDTPPDNYSAADELSDERKATLFQFLLRDLEIEGVPLLGCDADQTPTLQAALWTTMAELNEKDEGDRACLVLESIPMDALRVFVDDFTVLKTQQRLMEQLPELDRFSISLVGKGVGPGILVEAAERTAEQKQQYAALMKSSPVLNELSWQAAMKSFVSRMIAEKNVNPHMTDNTTEPSGLEAKGVNPGPVAYRRVGSPDICDTMSAFWNCMCELLTVPEDQLSSTIMCLPPVAYGADPTEAHNRFSAVSELVSRSLFLYRGEDVVDLWHLHPFYDRDLVFPLDNPQHGHLPPTGWLRTMLHAAGKGTEADNLSDDQLKLQNYQRRSPLPAVVFKRVSQVDAAATPVNGMVQLELGDGRIEMASGLETTSQNVLRMVSEGEDSLQAALETEIALTKE